MMRKCNTAWAVAALTLLTVPAWGSSSYGQANLEQACGLLAWSFGSIERCNPDLDRDGTVGAGDLALMKGAFFGSDRRADLNHDGVVNFQDLALLKAFDGYSAAQLASGWQPDFGYVTGGGACPSISLTPTPSNINPGDFITLTMSIDFTCDPTLGGGVDVHWDAALLNLVSWDPIPFADPDFASPGAIGVDNIDGLSFGAFGGITGPANVATITLQAVGPSSTQVTMSDDADGAVGPFVSAITFGPQAVDFPPADVNIGGSSITGTMTPEVILNFAGCVELGAPPPTLVSPVAPPTFDCTASGFNPTPGSQIIALGRGQVNCGPVGTPCTNVGMSITGYSGFSANCMNLNTGQLVPIGPLGGATSVDCSAEGLVVTSGQTASVQFRGDVP